VGRVGAGVLWVPKQAPGAAQLEMGALGSISADVRHDKAAPPAPRRSPPALGPRGPLGRETGVIMLSGGEKGSARGLPTRAKKPPSPNPLLLDLWGPCVSVSACHAPPSR
jgi:hypothetical protein